MNMLCKIWILFLIGVEQVADGTTFPTKKGVKEPGSNEHSDIADQSYRSSLLNSASLAGSPVARQPPFPPMAGAYPPQQPAMGFMQPGMGSPWQQGPFPGNAPFGMPNMPFAGGPNMPFSGGPNMPFGGGPNMPFGGGPNMPFGGGPNMPFGGGPNMPFAGGPNMPFAGGPNMPFGPARLPNFGFPGNGIGGGALPNMPLPAGGFGGWPSAGVPPGSLPFSGGLSQFPPGGGLPQAPMQMPQPSQWPFVESAAPPQSMPMGAGGLPLGQAPPMAGPPPPPAQPGGGPWQQPPVPAVYSQWLPSTLGSTAVQPSPPWTAPGTIVGGPQLSPQGPWSAQPMVGYSPPVPSSGHNPSAGHSPTDGRRGHGHSSGLPEFLRSANDGYHSSISARSADQLVARSNTGSNGSLRFLTPDSRKQSRATAESNADQWTNAHSYPASVQGQPFHWSSNYQISGPVDPYAIYASNVAAISGDQRWSVAKTYSIPLANGSAISVSDEDADQLQPEPTPFPTTLITPDALNPNTIFGGPSSTAFPDLSTGPGTSLPETGASLSAGSVRIGDILSFPHGTGFGAVPPPAKEAKMDRTHQTDQYGHPAVVYSSKGQSAQARKEHSGKGTNSVQALMGQQASQSPVAVAGRVEPSYTGYNGRAQNGLSRVPGSNKKKAGALMEIILKQIQKSKIVLYSRANCSECIEAEELLKNYSVPVRVFELDTQKKGEHMLALVQQMTHSTEVPLAFICGRFVGGHQRLRDLHVNEQITPLLRECTPGQRRSAIAMVIRRVED